MKLFTVALSLAVLGAVASPVWAGDPNPLQEGDSASQMSRGKEAFEKSCAMCHAPDAREAGRYLPGTASLMVKYKGERPGALEDRTDLLSPYIKLVIRRGSEGMPPFRKTEVSDSEMDAIAAYLARNAKQ